MTRKLVFFVSVVCTMSPLCRLISSTIYSPSGSWCPYEVETVVPCRVRNGTEQYYGSNLCWRSDNGSYVCAKKLMFRPKYTTTYKTVVETKYKCCPGRDGASCENECFNCTTYRTLVEKISNQEKRLGRLERYIQLHQNPSESQKHNQSSSTSTASTPSFRFVDVPSFPISQINVRLHNLADGFKEMKNRIQQLEETVALLNVQMNMLSYGNSIDDNQISAPSLSKDSMPEEMNDLRFPNHESTPENHNPEITPTNHIIQPDKQPEHRHRHAHNFPRSDHVSTSYQQKHSHDPVTTPLRVLEENLERGDIASTLNDDYGDDLNGDNSTEQYADQLQAKREHHSP